MRSILRQRAGTIAAIVVLLAAGTLSAAHYVSGRPAGGAALTAQMSSNRSGQAAMTHSPQLLKKLAGSATASVSTPPGPQGVDVASFQHQNGAAIDWSQVRGAGYEFAAVKASEGNYYTNPYASGDLAGASQAGLYTMAYHFAIPNVSTAAAQADYLITAAGTVSGAVPQLELDIEYDPYTSSDGTNECYGLTQPQMVSWVTAFSNEIRLKAGQSPVIYTTADWWTTCTGDSTAFSAYQLWVASYGGSSPTMPAAWPAWTFWQYTSQGSVPGISGNVDLSSFDTSTGTLSNPGQQTGAVGAPVWLQTHGLAGSAPYSATGLPPGLSLNTSTGLISGWLTTTGTYSASVTGSATATAPLATTGSTVTFTWTVNAAPNTGPQGRVVLNYGGKCMDDPAYQTANGTRVDLWTCTGGGNQNWTMAQDRTVRIYGKCLQLSGSGTADGTPVVLYTCNGSSAQLWWIGRNGHLVNVASGRCLDDPAYQTANGTKLDTWDCSNTGTNQRWTTPAGPFVSQIAPLCLDDPASSTANGTLTEVWTCNGGTNQHWTVNPDGTVRVFGKCVDVVGNRTAAGTPVDLWTCNGGGNQQWRHRPDGTLLNPQSGRCLADPADDLQIGTKLVIADCTTAAGEYWRVQ